MRQYNTPTHLDTNDPPTHHTVRTERTASPIPRHRPSRGIAHPEATHGSRPTTHCRRSASPTTDSTSKGLHVRQHATNPASPPTDAKSSEPRGHRTSRPPAHRERPSGTRHQNHEHSAQPARCTHTQQSTKIDQHQHTPISRRARINATTTPNPKTRKTNPRQYRQAACPRIKTT